MCHRMLPAPLGRHGAFERREGRRERRREAMGDRDGRIKGKGKYNEG